MMWETIFNLGNLLALVMWVALIALPRWPALLAAVLYVGVGLLCLAYVGLLAGLLGGALDPVRAAGSMGAGGLPDFSVAGIMQMFGSKGGVTVGWLHYLAFDLFIGLWIARDADAKRFSRWFQAPILLLTFLAGPAGLLLWLIVRERRARAAGRWS